VIIYADASHPLHIGLIIISGLIVALLTGLSGIAGPVKMLSKTDKCCNPSNGTAAGRHAEFITGGLLRDWLHNKK
jgi:hypothetical protein